MASLSTLVPINAKCKEGVVGTTTRMDTHTEVPTRVNKLLALPDIPLGEMHFRVKVKSSNRISRKQVLKGGGKQEEAQVAIISRESNAGASTASYDGLSYVNEMITKYDEAYCITQTEVKGKGGESNSHTSQTANIPDNVSNSLQKKPTKTLASVGRNQKNKCKISENSEGVSPKLKRRKVTRRPKGSKDSDASNILDNSFVQTNSEKESTMGELQATSTGTCENDDVSEEVDIRSPPRSPTRKTKKNNGKTRAARKSGMKHMVLKKTRFPNKNLMYESSEMCITIHEVDNTEFEVGAIKKFKVGDPIDVFIEPRDVGTNQTLQSQRREPKLVRYWLKRCLNSWTTARVVAVGDNIVGFQLEYDNRKLSSTFAGCLPLRHGKIRPRGLYSLQENKDISRVLDAVDSGHIRIDESILWNYPTENEWVMSSSKKELHLWPSYAKDIVFTLLCVALRYEKQISNEGAACIRRNYSKNFRKHSLNSFRAISAVFRMEILLSNILSYLSLMNTATHDPLEENKKNILAQKKVNKKIKSAQLKSGGNSSISAFAPVGNDRSAFRKRPKNERRIELRLSMLKRSLSMWEDNQHEAIHLLDGHDPETGLKNGLLHATSWSVKRLDPYMTHGRKPLLSFLQLLEHVADHNFTLGFVRGPYRPRVALDAGDGNPWKRCPFNISTGTKMNTKGMPTTDVFQPYPTNFSLKSLLESTRPSSDAPLLDKPIENLMSALMPYQSRCVRWMASVENREYMKHIPANEGNYGFRPIQCPNYYAKGTSFSKTSNSMLYVHTTMPHIVTLDAHKYRFHEDIYPVGGILADEMGLGKTVEIIALILLRPRPIQQYQNVHIPIELKKKAGVITRSNNTFAATESTTGTSVEYTIPQGFGSHFDKKKLRSYQGTNGVNPMLSAVDEPKPTFNAPELPIKATLIVVPQTILQQWIDEFQKHSPSLEVVPYHGVSRDNDFNQNGVWVGDFSKADVVLTTYKILREDEKNNYTAIQSPLLHCEWWRIVLDEAQMVRSITSVPAKLVSKLYRVHAWCSSGSPLSDRIHSLLGLFEVLDFDPVRDPIVLRRTLLTPYENGSYYGLARLSRIMQRVFWRHRKAHVNDQITLHSCNVIDDWLSMDALQHLVYGREVHDWDRKLLRQNVAPTDETRISNRRIVCLLQNLCHPSVAPSGGKHRYIVGSNSTESSYMVLEAKRLYNCFLDKYISCLRSYCSAMVDLGRGMYAHEVRELERHREEEQQRHVFNFQQQQRHVQATNTIRLQTNSAWANNVAEISNRRGEAAAGGVMALAKLRESVEIIRNVKSILNVNFDLMSRSAVEKSVRKKSSKMKTFATLQKLELSCLKDIREIDPEDQDCDNQISELRRCLGLDAVDANLAAGQRRNAGRERRATTVEQTMQSVLARNNFAGLKPLRSLKQTAKRTKMKMEEAYRDLKSLSFRDTSGCIVGNLKAADTVDNSNGKNIHMLKLTPVQNQDGGTSMASDHIQGAELPCINVATCSDDGAKVDRVLYHLKNVQRTDQGAKTIIFSQFISFLRLLDCKIKEQLSIESVVLSASSAKKIENTIEKFRSDNDTLVMLIPMKTLGGATGLSLTMAKYGIITEPSLDRTLEAQAIGRLYRIGQKADVKVWRLLLRNSVDEDLHMRAEQQ